MTHHISSDALWSRFWLVTAGLAVNAVVLVGLYVPNGFTSLRASYTERIYWLPFPIAFASVMLTLHALNGKWFGRVPPRQLADLLRQLPIIVRIVLALVCAPTLAQMAFSTAGPQPASLVRRPWSGQVCPTVLIHRTLCPARRRCCPTVLTVPFTSYERHRSMSGTSSVAGKIPNKWKMSTSRCACPTVRDGARQCSLLGK